MPYTFSIYPDEPIKVPQVGDIFIVKIVTPNAIDVRWGRHTHVQLELKEPEDAWYCTCKIFVADPGYTSVACAHCGKPPRNISGGI